MKITFDKEREGYWFRGHGFNFLAYVTEPLDGGGIYLECNHVSRDDDHRVAYFRIAVDANTLQSMDVVETLVIKELEKTWGPLA